jgi:hypothetical protein
MTTHANTTPRVSSVSTTLTHMYGPISCLIFLVGIGQVCGEVIL